MKPKITRRRLVGVAAPLGAAAWAGLAARPIRAAEPATAYAGFPSQDPARVRDTVLYAHTDVDRVKALVEASPALANAAVDWGFGDWESALGAASHMGRRDIARVLLDHGARPDIFTHAMLGNLAAVKGIIEAMPGVQRIPGPHGITLLQHARDGGEEARAVLAYLEKLGDADIGPSSKPLPEPVESYTGTFTYGDGKSFEIVGRQGNLGFRVEGGFPRPLFHLGGNEFHPAGASSVRIRIELADGKATRVTVLDPEVLVVGRRMAAAAATGG